MLGDAQCIKLNNINNVNFNHWVVNQCKGVFFIRNINVNLYRNYATFYFNIL